VLGALRRPLQLRVASFRGGVVRTTIAGCSWRGRHPRWRGLRLWRVLRIERNAMSRVWGCGIWGWPSCEVVGCGVCCSPIARSWVQSSLCRACLAIFRTLDGSTRLRGRGLWRCSCTWGV